MHFIIPAAAPTGPSCQSALTGLKLPNLVNLLRTLTPVATLQGQDNDLSPLPERVISQNAFADGLIPWAALRAAHLPHAAPRAAWGLITPCHLVVHADHIAMGDPAELDLEDAESQALLQSMGPYFHEDGLQLHYLQADTWLVQGEALRRLPTASLERVRGKAIDPWMPATEAARMLRRLQNEMQMLLYTDPINDARVARGAPRVNSFWLSGTGDLPTGPTPFLQATVLGSLQTSALRDDGAAWAHAWRMLDSGPLAQWVQSISNHPAATNSAGLSLSLCGQHYARTWRHQPRGLFDRLGARLSRTPLSALLKDL